MRCARVAVLDALLYLAGDEGGLDRRSFPVCCPSCVVCELFMESVRADRCVSVRWVRQEFGDRVALVTIVLVGSVRFVHPRLFLRRARSPLSMASSTPFLVVVVLCSSSRRGRRSWVLRSSCRAPCRWT